MRVGQGSEERGDHGCRKIVSRLGTLSCVKGRGLRRGEIMGVGRL